MTHQPTAVRLTCPGPGVLRAATRGLCLASSPPVQRAAEAMEAEAKVSRQGASGL